MPRPSKHPSNTNTNGASSSSSRSQKPVFFHGPHRGNGYLSQWYWAPFIVDGIRYETAENSEFVRRVVQGFRWGILDGLDPNGKNIVGATVLHTADGKFGCLLRLEPNYDTQVSVLVPFVFIKLTDC